MKEKKKKRKEYLRRVLLETKFLQLNSHQMNKDLGSAPSKTLWTILKMNKGSTLTNRSTE